tara:strand:- start:77 stop:640 length:564 start_codon:yes stop_codon:yes gene_type:complete
MKAYTIVLTFLLSSVFSQDISQLTSDQKKEYNRRKLTVEKVSETSGNMGWYWGIFAKKVDTWRAFKGLANQIESDEFFRVAGYDEEATKVRQIKESSQQKITGGWLLYGIGLFASILPKTETEDLGYGVTYEEVTYPYLLPGTLAWGVGLFLVYDGMLKKLKPVAPFQTASDIAEEYNLQLIKEITR